ncbi:MAG: hypothetical protein AAFQ94_18070 [Bacteroidota bacterium]
MLFTYKYIDNHPIYKLQEWIDHLFLEVWCKADAAVDFDIDMLEDDLKEITLAIDHDERIKTDYFYGPIQEVYKLFQGFDAHTKTLLAKAYRHNNAVEDLCGQNGDCQPFYFKELTAISEPLHKALYNFNKHLFESVIKLKVVQEKLGCTMQDHYNDFMEENDEGKCPFCGIGDMKGIYESRREAYDHYLPKGLYPFSAINFRNLVPMCNDCNSAYKLSKDPLYNKEKKMRRKAFYPFAVNKHPKIEIKLGFKKQFTDDTQPEDLDIQLAAKDADEELSTWNDLFGIEERYKAKCLKKNEGKYWMQRILDEWRFYSTDPDSNTSIDRIVDKEIRIASTNLQAEANFLKVAFLEGVRGQLKM